MGRSTPGSVVWRILSNIEFNPNYIDDWSFQGFEFRMIEFKKSIVFIRQSDIIFIVSGVLVQYHVHNEHNILHTYEIILLASSSLLHQNAFVCVFFLYFLKNIFTIEWFDGQCSGLRNSAQLLKKREPNAKCTYPCYHHFRSVLLE